MAESIYGVALNSEAVGRAALPEIRKRELLESGHVLGIANHFFLDERDLRYTQDIDEVLGEHWRPGGVLPEGPAPHCSRPLRFRSHAFPFGRDPWWTQGRDHYRAQRRAADVCPPTGRSRLSDRGKWGGARPSWKGFQSAQHPFSALPKVFSTDRTVKFGFKGALNYQIIVNWVIAARKSQGAFQADVNRADREEFVILESGSTDASARTDALFHALAKRAAHPRGVAATSAIAEWTEAGTR